jgi:uracil-DNA glycosylase
LSLESMNALDAASSALSEPLDEVLQHVQGAWRDVLLAWRATPAAEELVRFVDGRVRSGARVFPARVFRALELTPLEQTSVVIVGQDPYHGEGQAHGLAFSVNAGVKVPPSLRNIFKELERDLEIERPPTGNLEAWARQGVLLLNTSLTVEEAHAGSHARRGWEQLTDALIAAAADRSAMRPKVFMLWGSHAQAKEPMIREHVDRAAGQALVLMSNHPSPLSATRPPVPFLGSGHFRLANEWLRRVSGPSAEIDWRLP